MYIRLGTVTTAPSPTTKCPERSFAPRYKVFLRFHVAFFTVTVAAFSTLSMYTKLAAPLITASYRSPSIIDGARGIKRVSFVVVALILESFGSPVSGKSSCAPKITTPVVDSPMVISLSGELMEPPNQRKVPLAVYVPPSSDGPLK